MSQRIPPRFPFSPQALARPGALLRPPAAPPAMAPPRLPQVPAPPYDPPVPPFQAPQDAPILGRADDYEVKTIIVNDVPPSPTGGVGLTLYTTARRWRGCDVFLHTPLNALPPKGILSVIVYGISQGTRTFLASGKATSSVSAGHWPNTSLFGAGLWICGARSVAERFEVVTTYAELGGPSLVVPLTYSIVASDQCVEVPPRDLGAICAAQGVTAGQITAGTDFPVPGLCEVVGVQGVCGAGVAAARYLLFFDDAGFVGAPTFVWPLGATPGAGIVDQLFRWKPQGFFWQVAASSTPNTLTLANDCFVQAMIR